MRSYLLIQHNYGILGDRDNAFKAKPPKSVLDSFFFILHI